MESKNQINVRNIADALFSVSMSDEAIKNLVIGSKGLLDNCLVASSLVGRDMGALLVDNGVTQEQAEINAIRFASNVIYEIRDDIADFISRAKSFGFLPPSNPMLEIARFNTKRTIKLAPGKKGKSYIAPQFLDAGLSDDIMFNLDILLKLIEREKSGDLNLSEGSNKLKREAAQLSSYKISMGGYDIPLLDGPVDLMKFLPNVDAIKNRRINEVIGSLDFKNRVPKILFTAAYEPSNKFEGTIIGWKKILDANSYSLKKKDLFKEKEIVLEYSNEDLEKEKSVLSQYVNDWILSFYNQHDLDTTYFVLDTSYKRNRFYTYSLTARQNIRTDKNFIFKVDKAPAVMSSLQIKNVTDEMTNYVKENIEKKISGATADDISPYPFLSKRLYGHDKYDWFLAAINVQAAKSRGEDKSQVRKYSYLGSSMSFISDSITNSKFYKPANPNDVIKNIKESIATFGISQTLIEIIQAVGLNYFFGSKELPQDDEFERATTVFDEPEDLAYLKQVLSAIDPETATVDVQSLISNLVISTSTLGEVDEASSPTEIDLGKESLDENFIAELSSTDDALDLTTFEGISDFIRVIRLFFDLSPNRTVFADSTDVSEKDDVDITLPSGISASSPVSKIGDLGIQTSRTPKSSK